MSPLYDNMDDALEVLASIRTEWGRMMQTSPRFGWAVLNDQPLWEDGGVVDRINGRFPVVFVRTLDDEELAIAAARNNSGYALTPGHWARS